MRNATSNKTIVALFEEQAKKTPQRIALIADDGQYTYQTLNERANQLAHFLINDHGTALTDTCIAIVENRSAHFIIAALAILKSGAAYLPLDPELPAQRLNFMLEDAMVKTVLTQSANLERLPSNIKANVIPLDQEDIKSTLQLQASSNPNIQLQPNHLAYVIYTSGSTGKPKGVMIEHRNVVQFVKNMTYIDLTQNDIVAQMSNVMFDASVFEMWGALLNGACVTVLPKSAFLNPSVFKKSLIKQKISTLIITPALFYRFLESDITTFKSLKYLLLGGEKLMSTKLLNELIRNSATAAPEHLVHLYGPTENTVCSTSYNVPLDQLVAKDLPIGSAINGTQAYVLDPQLQPVAAGVSGELYLSGDGLARGYLNRAELTQQCFIKNPFSTDGSRLYRTGDLVHFQTNGELVFEKRVDQQIKISGYRVELEEISKTLLSQENVKEALVLKQNIDGHSVLIAYITQKKTTDHPQLFKQELRDSLSKLLPHYMMPSAFILLESLPLNLNGKLDSRQLPPVSFESCQEYAPPTTATEKKIFSLWKSILPYEKAIGLNDNFFMLGGNSLSAMQLAATLSTQHQVKVQLSDIFTYPTLKTLAARLHDLIKAQKGLLLQPQKHPFSLPLSFAQKRLWLAYQLVQNDRPQTYNEKISLQFKGPLNVVALKKSLQALVDRHDILRTFFPRVGMQVVGEWQIELEHHQLNQDLSSLITEIADHDFGDLSKPPLMRAVLIDVSENQHVLCLVFHHIIIDGLSLPILLRDINALYNHFAHNIELALPKLQVQYADFTLWEQKRFYEGEFETALDYWRTQLYGASGLLGLPLDYQRPKKATFVGGTHIFYAKKSIAKALQTLAQQHKVSLFTVMLSSISILLYRYNQEEDFILGIAHGERPDPKLNDLLGFFVNMLPIRIQQTPNLTVSQVLQQVHKTLSEAYQNNAPIETILGQLDLPQHVGQHPLFQVMVTLHNMPPLTMDFNNLETSLLESSIIELSNMNSAKFDMSFEIEHIADGRLAVKIEYAKDLFKHETILRIANQWLILWQHLVENPSAVIDTLSLLTDEQQQKRIEAWSQPGIDHHQKQTILSLFDAQVQKHPDMIAVVDGETKLTYRELNTQANRIAHYLLKDNDAPLADTCIAVVLNRSADFIITALGILKSGAAYLPLDPKLPGQRLHFMLEDAKVKQLFTITANQNEIPSTSAKVICLDQEETKSLFLTQVSSNPKVDLKPNHLAYVIYTSGSTGRPKGVMIEHQNVTHLVTNISFMEINQGDVVANVCNITFDVSAFEIWGALLNGASVVVYPKSVLLNPAEFKEALLASKVSILMLTTALFYRLLLSDITMFRDIKYVVFAGEKLMNTEVLHDLLTTKPPVTPQYLINAYGPTENTVFSTAYTVPFDKPIPNELPIGSPINNVKAYVLDSQLQPVAEGLIGELYLGGPSLARGYINSDKRTKKRFIANPFLNDGSYLYSTGDLVRHKDNGDIVFVKRTDQQVKVSGYRIELEEISQALLSQKNVKEGLVLKQFIDGRYLLVAYVAPNIMPDDPQQFKQTLRSDLSEMLPYYMLPTAFVILDNLPLNLNDKIDYHQLTPVSFESQTEHVPATTTVEKKLIALWGSVLQCKKPISITDNFFLLGGSSLLAMQLTSLIYEEYGPISYTDLFRQPTIESQAQLIKTPKKQRVTPTQKIKFFKREAILDKDIRPSESWSPQDYPNNPQNIFLTGVTGFLGIFLLNELLRKNNTATIYCLVRAENHKHAQMRITKTLEKYHLKLTDKQMQRVNVVVGNIEKPQLGLPFTEYNNLAEQVEIIYHLASDVSFTKPYSALKAANVEGVKHILRFAIHHKLKPLHHVSTAAVFSFAHYFQRTSCLQEKEVVWDHAFSQALPHDLGYVQSKSISEKLMWQAIARGLPISVHRPGFILCHSKTGAGSDQQMWARLIKDCIAIKSFPRFTDLKEEFITVDYASEAIVHISQQQDCIAKVFHIVPPPEHNITTNQLFDLIKKLGYTFKEESLLDWRNRLQKHVENGGKSSLELLKPLFYDPLYDSQTLMEIYQNSPEYDISTTVAALEGSGIVCPVIDNVTLKCYINYLFDQLIRSDTDSDDGLLLKSDLTIGENC